VNTRFQRHAVVAALFVLSLILYIDRAAISSAKGPIAADLSLSDAQMGAVFSAFALGYAAAQVPSGWFADRFGPRRALATVVLVASVVAPSAGHCRLRSRDGRCVLGIHCRQPDRRDRRLCDCDLWG
jgi:ACS family glucarate transporter-like MFS transporter